MPVWRIPVYVLESTLHSYFGECMHGVNLRNAHADACKQTFAHSADRTSLKDHTEGKDQKTSTALHLKVGTT